MKKIGIIGGLSPASTTVYYKKIVDSYLQQTGNYPELFIHSVDMNTMNNYLVNNDIEGVAFFFHKSVDALINAGADVIAMASNTPHIVFNNLREYSTIPMISIVEETVKTVMKISLKKRLGLLGTRFTMQAGFYEDIFSQNGLELYTPAPEAQDKVHSLIFSELINGIFTKKTENYLLSVIDQMHEQYDIDAIVLGCTELPLILKDGYKNITFLNTMEIHIKSIVKYSLGKIG